MDFGGRGIAQRLMGTLLVVERQIPSDPFPGLPCIGILAQIDLLILDRPPQALGEDIVHASATPVHRDADTRRS